MRKGVGIIVLNKKNKEHQLKNRTVLVTGGAGSIGSEIVRQVVKYEPKKVEYGLGIPELDQEGRMITLFFDKWVFINTYYPNGGGGPERLAYKLKFYDAFLKYIEKLKVSD